MIIPVDCDNLVCLWRGGFGEEGIEDEDRGKMFLSD
jgi:hypothetical protein